ncbi:uncharacterized protein SOCE26_005060 [Sorangium cellulosum]|uniref:Cytochrome c domain-containing protein n=1 Tax=Sorangium cellulosum TaxID=56 RepID=A0A2L0EIN1_SORCE|nr:hypothetical protein [Sorangium cellulosum]AUX39124.1 uncharacterized protein SOCE26_005060 [Sorangium cellulosum]
MRSPAFLARLRAPSPLHRLALGCAALGCAAPGCVAEESTRPVDPVEVAPISCTVAPLPLQNPRAHTLGETFYLPRIERSDSCPADAAWELASAPPGSKNVLYEEGAPEVRFTPDVAGEYTFRLRSVPGADMPLRVLDLAPAERFRNHYLTPLYGAARVGDELWTANGASPTVTRLARAQDGVWTRQGEITVGSWPAAVAHRDPLPYVVVAQRGSDTIGFIDRTRGVLEDALWVGDEPTGLAIAPDADRLYVSLPTMGQVAVVDLARREVEDRIALGFDPRALALSEDGTRLFVAAYRSGNPEKDLNGTYGLSDDQDLWIVNTVTLEVEKRVSGVSSSLRALALSGDGAELYVAATDGNPVPSQADVEAKPFVHEVVALGADPGAPRHGRVLRRVDLTRDPGSAGPVVSPAGVLAVGDTLWVAAESSGVVVALDRATFAEKARFEVGPGARQLVQLDDAGTIGVHCFQSLELWVIPPDGGAPYAVALADDPRPAAVALGERVFTRPGQSFADNHSCSSCHVEAQNEGMIWNFGPGVDANIRPLQLLDATTPIGWDGYVTSTENFGYQGPSSIVARPPSPEEAEALAAFLSSLLGAPRATGYTRLDGSYTDAALRGKALFQGKATCAGCHVPPLYTSRALIEVGKSGIPADVPTLLGAYRHGVYFVKGQARGLEAAADVALDYVGVDLSPDERADLVAFLRELTPKGAAPLAMWPDIDSGEAVYPDVTPWVAFSEPIDDTAGDRTAEALAREFVILERDGEGRVDGTVEVDGGTLRFVPAKPLDPSAAYAFRVLEGLPFRSGGALEAERRASFTVARPATGTLPARMKMVVQVPSQGGEPLALEKELEVVGEIPGALTVRIVPLTVGTQQRQEVWARLDGDTFLLEGFAMPVSPRGAAGDAGDVKGTVTAVDPETGVVTRIEGTLALRAPGRTVPEIPFVITALPEGQ